MSKSFEERMSEAGFERERNPAPVESVHSGKPLARSASYVEPEPEKVYPEPESPYVEPTEAEYRQADDEERQAGAPSMVPVQRVNAETIPDTIPDTDAERLRKRAIAKAIGLDKATPEQRELAIAWANRYSLDLLLKHIVIIDGRPYITRDGLLHVAHRSDRLDGIEVSKPTLEQWEDEKWYWTAIASVWRTDMAHPFTFTGRYPLRGSNAKYGPEMAVKVAESMSLRRAFDVSAPSADERTPDDDA